VAWPSPRFVNNNNGTLTDQLTGLTWTQSACGAFTWDDAETYAASLASGGCGLSDGSVAGDWRMPNIVEVLSLIDWETGQPADCLTSNGPTFCYRALWTNTPSAVEELGLAFIVVHTGADLTLSRYLRGMTTIWLMPVKRQ
jgi:hypothetical protein